MARKVSPSAVIIGLWALSAGCYVKYLHYTLVKPPVITVENVRRAGILNRSIPAKGTGGFIEGLITGEAIKVDREIARLVVQNLAGALPPHIKADAFLIPEEMETKVLEGFGEPLPGEKIKDLCHRYAADVIISLEYLDSDIHRSKPRQVQKTSKDKSGNVIKTVSWEVEVHVTTRAGFRVYLPVSEGEYLVSQRDIVVERRFSASFKDGHLAQHWHPPYEQEMAADVVASYVALFKPQYIPRTVPVYTGKTDEVKRCAEPINQGKYQEAIKECALAFEQEIDPKGKARIAHNIAVAHEMLSLNAPKDVAIPHISEAIKWEERGIGYYRMGSASEYKRYLEERLGELQGTSR